MFIVALDFKGVVKKRYKDEFLENLRRVAFDTIPTEVKENNELDIDVDCIALLLKPPKLVKKLLGFTISGKTPDFLALIIFSAKDVYIPFDTKVISAIAAAMVKYLNRSYHLTFGKKELAAWVMPIVDGKWDAVSQ